MTELPIRELRDPAELRAIVHPLRLRILEILAVHGPSTATQVAERVDESPANCSWHLRQLAKYGFVEEAGGGTGRQRPWRAVPRGTRWGERPEQASPELVLAEDAATEVMLDQAYGLLREWVGRLRQEPHEWQQASFSTHNLAFLTPEELAELSKAVNALLLAHPERLGDPSTRPPDARPVRLMAFGFPGRPEGGG